MASDLHPLQIAAWRAMTPDQKWQLAKASLKMVRDAARRRIRRQNPDATAEEIEQKLAKFFIRART